MEIDELLTMPEIFVITESSPHHSLNWTRISVLTCTSWYVVHGLILTYLLAHLAWASILADPTLGIRPAVKAINSTLHLRHIYLIHRMVMIPEYNLKAMSPTMDGTMCREGMDAV